MSSQTTALPKPKYALHALTTSELSRYRADLEHEISGHAPTAAVIDDLRRLLDEVLLEQGQRRRIRANI